MAKITLNFDADSTDLAYFFSQDSSWQTAPLIAAHSASSLTLSRSWQEPAGTENPDNFDAKLVLSGSFNYDADDNLSGGTITGMSLQIKTAGQSNFQEFASATSMSLALNQFTGWSSTGGSVSLSDVNGFYQALLQGGNIVLGSSGDNVLTAGQGNSLLLGGRGNDTYIIDSNAQVILDGDASAITSLPPDHLSTSARYYFYTKEARNYRGASTTRLLRHDVLTGNDREVSGGYGSSESVIGWTATKNGRYALYQCTGAAYGQPSATYPYALLLVDMQTPGSTKFITDHIGSFLATMSENGRYVAYTNSDTGDIDCRDVLTGTTSTLVKKSSGDNSIRYISDDGTKLIYQFQQDNFISTSQTAIYNPQQLFMWDSTTQTRTLLSADELGTSSKDDAWFLQLTGNGRYVFFRSGADLGQHPTADSYQIYRKDLETGALLCVTESKAGACANQVDGWIDASSDGRYAVFASESSNLIPGEKAQGKNYYLKDLQSGDVKRLPAVQANTASHFRFNDDNSLLVYQDGVVGSAGGAGTIFAFDLNASDDFSVDTVKASIDYTLPEGVNNLVLEDSIFAGKGEGNSADNLIIGNARGNYLLGNAGDDLIHGEQGDDYIEGGNGNDTLDGGTGADTLKGGAGSDTYIVDNPGDVIVEDRECALSLVKESTDTITQMQLGADGDHLLLTTQNPYNPNSPYIGFDNYSIHAITLSTGDELRVSSSAAGEPSTGFNPHFTNNYQKVVFESSATDYVAGDRVNSDVFLKDLNDGSIFEISSIGDAHEINWPSRDNSVSDDSRYVAFSSQSTLFSTDDANGHTSDIFIKDLETGNIRIVSTSAAGSQSSYPSFHPAISADGHYIAFESQSYSLATTSSYMHSCVLLKDLTTGVVVDVAAGLSKAYGHHAKNPTLSADGRYLAFETDAALDDRDTNDTYDIYRYDRITHSVALVSISGTGTPTSGDARNAHLSNDGRYVSFESAANNLVNGDTDNHWDVFRKDMLTGNLISLSQDVNMSTAPTEHTEAGDIYGSSISADGSKVAFAAVAGLKNFAFLADCSGQDGDSVIASWSYTLGQGVENLTLSGTANLRGSGNDSNNLLAGNAASNALFGAGGNDTLNGGAGNDTLDGGSGNDTYVVDNAKDVIKESSKLLTEIDTVFTSVNWTLGANLENLFLTGNADLVGKGNVAGNLITGNGGANLLQGDAGNDTLNGGDGNDTLDGGAGIDVLAGGTGNDLYKLDSADELALLSEEAGDSGDALELSYKISSATTISLSDNLANIEHLAVTGTGQFNLIGNDADNALTGNGQSNLLIGGLGNDTLDGGAGADTLNGGEGDDTYIVDSTADKLEGETAGRDTVMASLNWTLAEGFENLSLTGKAVNGTGNTADNAITGNNATNLLVGADGNDTLTGDAGNDTLLGGAGSDSLSGGAGNDTYEVDSKDDVVLETIADRKTGGIDLVKSSVTWALGGNLENLILTGSDNINAAGNALANALTGNSGDNVLDSGEGIDTLVGGLGNDTYVVDNTKDVITETSKLLTEIDKVFASVDWTLGANLENLFLTGGDDLTGKGNAAANQITGNAGANQLLGDKGNDSLTGDDGNDTLDGGAGLDTLVGGTGNDTYLIDSADELALLTEEAGDSGDALALSYKISSATTISLSGNLANIEHLAVTGTGLFNLTGNDANNALTGNAQANMLHGGAGNDTLDGNEGADTLNGGEGDDTYIVDNAADTLEGETGGSDIVVANLNWTLAEGFENLSLTGKAANGTGNTADNALAGNASNNLLAGADGNDTLTGGSGNDTLAGGSGNDSMGGGLGSDVYEVDSADDVVLESESNSKTGGIDLVKSSVSWTLGENLENLTLTGSDTINAKGNALANALTGNSGDNVLDGGEGKDSLSGAAGNDTLNGGLGADNLAGGLGNDTYIVDNAKDVINETSKLPTEIDAVSASLNWTLGANLENLFLTGSADLTGKGNAAANQLIGNSGANQLLGDKGNDTLRGGDGNDTLDGGAGLDVLAGGTGNDLYQLDSADELALLTEEAGDSGDALELSYKVSSATTISLSGNLANIEHLAVTGTGLFNLTGNDANNALTGNAQANRLIGGIGNDTLDGGTGNDTLDGGNGDDTYFVESIGTVLLEDTGGFDVVFSAISITLSAGIECLTLYSGSNSNNATGNDEDNEIVGNDGNNILNGMAGADDLHGGGGNDTLIGGAGDDNLVGYDGNDTYEVDSAGDTLYEYDPDSRTGGIDLVKSSVSWTLGDNLENLTLTGSDNINAAGNALANALTGNSGDNVLDGGDGIDTLVGGLGNDTYIVDNAKDVINETSKLPTEIDAVSASLNWTLGANLENLFLTGSADLTGKGNTAANQLIGNSGANQLLGDKGNDTLRGGDGNDTLDGGEGADTLNGGEGDDTYIVDNAADSFEGETGGNDTVVASLNWTLSDGLENLSLSGKAANGTGNGADNTLTGNAGNNLLSGAAGNDTLIGGLGNDTLSGGEGDDLYRFVRGAMGSDVVSADTGTDEIAFLSGSTALNASQLWFRHVAKTSDLEISIIGTGDKVTVKDWYGGNHVEKISLNGELLLQDSSVESLVSAMAAFKPPASGQTSLTATQHNALDTVIAASWQSTT